MDVLPTLPRTPHGALRALARLRREAAHEIERLTASVELLENDAYVEVNSISTASYPTDSEPPMTYDDDVGP